MSLPAATGWERQPSIAQRISGRKHGRTPISPSPPARSENGCRPWAIASSRRRMGGARGGWSATSQGNSVPRFHITWGTGPGGVELFERRVREAEAAGQLRFRWRHRVDRLIKTGDTVTGVAGSVLESRATPRGAESSRIVTGDFELSAQAVIVRPAALAAIRSFSGRIGRPAWGRRRRPWWPACRSMSTVVCWALPKRPAAGSSTAAACGTTPKACETGIPSGENHGIRILPGPSSLWLDATGKRLPAPFFPGYDTLGTLQHILATG
ncbi:putative oxidoreductase [Pseudorhizobium tarimense]|uniref:Oxidoreductase n=1 Tax=Pseudorhizobium tarimense TaxID=1079109 RepID=A0ABV2H3R0_9HYPH